MAQYDLIVIARRFCRIEFEKGKAGVAVALKDKLPALIDALIGAVRAGVLGGLFCRPR